MSDLYYIAPEERGSLNEGVAVLTGSEAQHLTRVMRKKVGEEADLFDGPEKSIARESIDRRDRVELTVLETREGRPSPTWRSRYRRASEGRPAEMGDREAYRTWRPTIHSARRRTRRRQIRFERP